MNKDRLIDWVKSLFIGHKAAVGMGLLVGIIILIMAYWLSHAIPVKRL